jgi:two-component system cell cycle sensor histidine kinase/response regulator CckA
LESERNRTEETLRQSERDLSIRNRIASIFLTIPDDEMYGEVLQVILEVTESQYGFFGYIAQSGDLVCPSMTRDVWNQCQVPHKAIFFPREKWGGIWGQSLKEKKTLYSNKQLHVPDGHIPISNSLAVPIIHQEKVIGQLVVANKASDYTLKDQKLLETIADHIAPILHARLQRDNQERERRRSEDALRESEAMYSTLVKQAREGVAIIEEGILTFANRAMTDITGYAIEEVTGKPFLDMVASECSDLIAQIYQLRMAGKKLSTFYEIKLICRDGTTKDVELSFAAIDYHGKPAMMIMARDITERKKTGDELLKIQKLESLGILAGGIAHDFNNLLAAIIGGISLLELEAGYREGGYQEAGYEGTGYEEAEHERSEHEKETAELLEMIKTASLQAKSLTRQLLIFAKGGAPVKNVASVSELLKDTVGFALSGSQVRCELSIADDLWWVKIDKEQIIQTINNIMINAEQSMPGGGTIEVRAENIVLETQSFLPLKEGRYVKISIKDQGIGISEENMVKIFDPYFTTKQKGSGLGLATAYSIIKKHNGFIRAESQIGVGTTFHIYLPSAEAQIPTTTGLEEVEAAEEGKFRPLQGKILVMDDQQLVRNTIGRILIHLGYEVEFATNGTEAIDIYEKAKESKHTFDAVILDLTIQGGMGGKETIQKLFEIDPDVKAIVSSGYSNDPIMSEYQKYGFKGIVTKPYEMKELRDVLHKVIGIDLHSGQSHEHESGVRSQESEARS